MKHIKKFNENINIQKLKDSKFFKDALYIDDIMVRYEDSNEIESCLISEMRGNYYKNGMKDGLLIKIYYHDSVYQHDNFGTPFYVDGDSILLLLDKIINRIREKYPKTHRWGSDQILIEII